MPIKSILVPLADSEGAGEVLDAAFALAGTFGAHVNALHLRADPTQALGDFAGETISPALVDQVLTAAEKRAETTATKTRKAFDAAAKKAKAATGKTAAKGALTASYEEVTGMSDYVVEEKGRLNDLVVVRRARDARDAGVRVVAETALMETGRPVLLVPPKPPAKVGSNVAIAWNGSREAARAVGAAMPFLMRATSVTAVSVGDSKLIDQKGLVEYLARHGVKAKAVVVKPGADTGKAIVNAAVKAGANLLVMGAFTHSRVRELIFGGVTEHALENSRLPVLMIH